MTAVAPFILPPDNGNNLLQRQIPCITGDGERVHVEIGLLLQSNTFKAMWRDLNMTDESQLAAFDFPVKTLSKEVFLKVVDWMHSHVGQAEPVIQEEPITHERKWFELTDVEKDFFSIPVELLAELLSAASFLDIQALYIYACQSMAGLLKDKTPEQVRDMLGLEDDLTEEEKEEIRQQNIWAQY